MQETTVGKLGNKDLKFFQCVDLEEAQKANLPNGTHFYWEYDGQRIYTPGEIVTLVIQHSQEGSLQVNTMINSRSIQDHYKNLYEAQRKSILEHMGKMKTQLQKQTQGMPQAAQGEALRNLDQTMDFYKKHTPFPGVDGVFRPTRKQAEVLLHGKDNLDKTLTKEQQAELFGGEDGN